MLWNRCIGVAIGVGISSAALAGIPGVEGSGGDVDWGGSGNRRPGGSNVTDKMPDAPPHKGVKLKFWWTTVDVDGVHHPHDDFDAFQRTIIGGDRPTPGGTFHFHEPKVKDGRPPITDWDQEVSTFSAGRSTLLAGSKVAAGNIQKGAEGWEYHPLSELDGLYGRVPDLAPTMEAENFYIYAAVNLELYLTSNPNGFLDGAWTPGQTLNDLGIEIVDGHIPGLEGITFATTDFKVDPLSVSGYVPLGGAGALLNSGDFQSTFGDITILAEHTVTPAPAGILALAGCTLIRTRRRS